MSNYFIKVFIYFSFILLSINLSANNTITVGAMAVPGAEILEFAKPILKKKV